MKRLLFITFIGVPFFCFAQSMKSHWDALWYSQYTHISFAELNVANQRINPQNIDYPLLNAAIFYETNLQRVKNKLPLFKHSEALEKAACGHSKDMVRYKFYSHHSEVKGKENMIERLNIVGIENTIKAENLAEYFAMEMERDRSYFPPSVNGGYFSYQYKGKPILFHTYISFAKELVAGWMKSSGHRHNILYPKLHFLGCGAFYLRPQTKDDVPKFRCTQNFSETDALGKGVYKK